MIRHFDDTSSAVTLSYRPTITTCVKNFSSQLIVPMKEQIAHIHQKLGTYHVFLDFYSSLSSLFLDVFVPKFNSKGQYRLFEVHKHGLPAQKFGHCTFKLEPLCLADCDPIFLWNDPSLAVFPIETNLSYQVQLSLRQKKMTSL